MKKILFILAFVLSDTVCWANGSAVMWSSALTLSCSPQGRHIPEIMLSDEQIEISSQGPYSHIKVTYVLTNTSKKRFKNIAYGFPVDWYGSGKQQWGDNDLVFESERLYGWSDDYVKDVRFTIDRKSLAWKCSADTILTHAISENDVLTEEEKLLPSGKQDEIIVAEWYDRMIEKYDIDITPIYDLCRKWYYTSFDFAPRQRRILCIEYTIANNFGNSLYDEKGRFKTAEERTFDTAEGVAEILYDFTPAAYWGNGKAMKFNILLDVQDIDTDYSSPIEGEWMERFVQGPVPYRWNFRDVDFDMASALPLRIKYWFSRKRNRK